MSICCEIDLGTCPRCKGTNYVHLDRASAKQTGFGCLDCQTAVEVEGKCLINGCPEKVSYYVGENRNYILKECKNHALLEEMKNKKLDKLLPKGILLIEGKIIKKKK
ncbi:MAG: hypothetical protein KGI08_02790 [Thaumarchaeota archaeon]|nr:hypothetical protein [Nitrososphaerota archaeon]